MTEIDSKKQQESDYIRQHTLTEQDLRKLIAEKYERAKVYSKAEARKREVLLEDC